VGRI
jgi:hypothetical protein